jgi:hypothetical protein
MNFVQLELDFFQGVVECPKKKGRNQRGLFGLCEKDTPYRVASVGKYYCCGRNQQSIHVSG